MSHSVELINTSSLTEMASNKELTAVAKPVKGFMLQGHSLHILDGDKEWIVSTYLSDKPKLYKKADALLKEAKKMGLHKVTFEL